MKTNASVLARKMQVDGILDTKPPSKLKGEEKMRLPGYKIVCLMIIGMVILSLGGCVTINLGGTPAPAPAYPTEPSDFEVSPTLAVVKSELTEETVLNAQYLSPMRQQPIQLVNGEFSGVVDGVALNARIQPGVQFGDLNEDGIDDAAFLMAEDTGGSGVFVSLVVVYSRGELFQQAQGQLIDDRPVIHTMSIDGGVVRIAGLIHSPSDAMVNPTTVFSAEFDVFGDQIMRTRQTSAFGNSAEHLIEIESPLDGETVSGSIRLKGSMPIGPFENNLALRIIDEQGNELIYQGFMVSAEDMGAPAVFDNLIALPGVGPGSQLLVTLLDLSMADGTPIAIDSVRVTVN
jgi:hypothetical protein